MKLVQPTIQSLRLQHGMGKLLDKPLALGYGPVSTVQKFVLHNLPKLTRKVDSS
jgi:hypothetical protein